jgi:hypothetical protein
MTAGANDNLVAAALALLRPLAANVGTVGELARSLARASPRLLGIASNAGTSPNPQEAS